MIPVSDPIKDHIEQLFVRFEKRLHEREVATNNCLEAIAGKVVDIKYNITSLSERIVKLEQELRTNIMKIKNATDVITANNPAKSSYIRELCDSLSLPGLRYVSEKGQPKLHRLLWILLHLGAILISFVYIQNAYFQWQSSPVIQSFKSVSTKVDDIPFPAVTMCFPIPMREDYDRWEIISRCLSLENDTAWMCGEDEWNTLIVSNEINSLQPSEFNNVTLSDWVLYEESLSNLYNQSNRLLTGEEYHMHVDKLMLDCGKWKTNRLVHLLKGELCDGSLSPKVLIKKITDDGIEKLLMCVTYNGVKHGPQYKGLAVGSKERGNNFDEESGIPFPLSTCDWKPEKMFKSECRKGSSPVYTRKGARIIFYPSTLNGGAEFSVMIHNPAEHPVLEVMKSFTIPMRKSVIFDITPELITAEDDLTAVEVSKRGCLFSYERSLAMFEFYSYHNCYLECQINCGLAKCGCIPSSIVVLNNTLPVCSGLKSCDQGTCECDCPYDCVSLTYDVNMEINKDLAFNSVIAKLEYKNIEFSSRFRYSVTSPAEFVAYSLGILGVFNGFSVMLVWEILYWLTLRLWFTIKKTVKADS